MMQDLRQKYLREEYTARINRVIDYIEANKDGGYVAYILLGMYV